MSIKSVMLPEWAAQDWLWIGFPHLAEEWPGWLEPAQEQIADFASAVAESGQQVRLLVRDAANEARARALVSDKVTLERRVYGDVWLRDTGPLVVAEADGTRSARRFGFNGWGGKYLMPGDKTVGAELARDAGLAIAASAMILEGGAVDGDGTGLGFSRVLWLGNGLINDHTDGHVDNLARFVGPNRLVVPQATGKDDPNAAIYADAAARAEAFGVEVVRIPSPGLLTREGVVEPASYVNFAITSHLVVVPTFGSPHDAEGVAAIAALFPDRDTIGLPGEAVLAGGGGFHCASQQMPAPAAGV